MNTKEIADAMVQATIEYTQAYFEAFDKNLDKQLLAALHCGFISALTVVGYPKETLDDALTLLMEELARIEMEVKLGIPVSIAKRI